MLMKQASRKKAKACGRVLLFPVWLLCLLFVVAVAKK
jgi:hypothetical protein